MLVKALAGLVLISNSLLSVAEDLSPPANHQYANASPYYVSVEDSLRTMDKNSDGIVTVYEVRAFIESKHGKDYKKEVLDDMESSANGKSCSTPFAKSLY
ncbi:MAG TPA: hypothetical protein VK974_07735 [Methylophilaceae bacterium]|nr:hypothetical protein [Methylophilaceae bacterium]